MNRLVLASLLTFPVVVIATAAKPTISIFLKENCPHTLKAMPAIRQLSTDLRGKATLNIYLDIPADKMGQAKKKFKVTFNFLADPDAVKMRQQGGKHSLDAVVQSSGGILAFDGFGPKFLDAVSKATGVKLSAKVYPTKRISGCGL